jgi:protein-tyrosine-phosphatase
VHNIGLARCLLAEFVGTALLVTVVVGSGIAAQQMSPDDTGLQLLENSPATVFGLAVLILMFGPVSGAHFNPVVTAADWLLGRRARNGIVARHAVAYITVQTAGGIAGAPTVLFLCTHNAGRSQMALGFFNHLAGDQAVAWSGGSEPGNAINPAAVEAMAEVGIDITGKYPRPWTDEIVAASDVIVTMGCGDACPIFPGHRYEEWVLPDPAGQQVVRPIRDEIEGRVRQLLSDLGVAATR